MITALLLATLCASTPTTVYLVRHAEKVVEPKVDDPDLTDKGARRAEQLLRVLRDAKITAIHATEYKRTQLTVAPLAKALKIEIEKMSSKDSAAFAKHVLEKHAGQTVLIAGHSNTIGDIAKALGVKDPPVLTDADYDGLYVVIRDGDGREPVFLRLHYGE